MTSPPIRVLVADTIHEQGIANLRAVPGFHVDAANGMSDAELVEKLPGYDALIVRSKTKVKAPAIKAAASRLRIIGRAGIGVDNIDTACATEHGIFVCNTPDSNATTTAELAIAHLFSLSRNLPRADASMRAGEWAPAKFMGAEVSGKTVGVVGFGTIGRIFASRALGLKMHVVAFDPLVTDAIFEEHGVERCELDDLVRRADYISLHCPLVEKTRNLFDASRLAMMKTGARIINCARGGIIDEVALYDALDSGHLAGAALDVFAAEPPKDSPLLTLDSVVLTPHLGASTEEAQTAVSLKIADTIATYLTTGVVNDAINVPRVPAEQVGKARPYRTLARSLGGLVAALCDAPITGLDVAMHGRAADLDSRTITAEAIAGALGRSLEVKINEVNAAALAKRHGIAISESRSEQMHDYVALIELTAKTAKGTTKVAGTLLGEKQPRIVDIDGYEVEAVPEGQILFTRHDDRPGVVGAIGGILGREGINISRMQIGTASGRTQSIALIGIAHPLADATIAEIRKLPAIEQAIQIEL